ncbi:FAD-dependent thymidylate synthase [Clostridium sp.]|uniref:FAD-dependent thymidylate synthase n=1 Tax=Clostridium sp. TaxID=1506 RepID=UPI001A58150B|nr:FAD-dependent thymidylate synthase [Clostridium sp.]MBK5239867.1 FAD-dependent thymidylate synthase [Clostridium sp.]
MKVTLIRYTNNPVNAIESAASNCYNSEITGGKIMEHCYKSGHHSVLEFCDFHFHIEGVSRALSHQLVRSRLASFAQRSQRYVNEDGFDYVIPESIKNNDNLLILDIYEKSIEVAKKGYKILVSHGVPAEDARFVLPNACETVIDMKVNLRELMHFMNERLCTCSQWEIRELANLMRKLVISKEPKFNKYLVPKCEKNSPYNFCTETKSRCCGRNKHISDVILK